MIITGVDYTPRHRITYNAVYRALARWTKQSDEYRRNAARVRIRALVHSKVPIRLGYSAAVSLLMRTELASKVAAIPGHDIDTKRLMECAPAGISYVPLVSSANYCYQSAVCPCCYYRRHLEAMEARPLGAPMYLWKAHFTRWVDASAFLGYQHARLRAEFPTLLWWWKCIHPASDVLWHASLLVATKAAQKEPFGYKRVGNIDTLVEATSYPVGLFELSDSQLTGYINAMKHFRRFARIGERSSDRD